MDKIWTDGNIVSRAMMRPVSKDLVQFGCPQVRLASTHDAGCKGPFLGCFEAQERTIKTTGTADETLESTRRKPWSCSLGVRSADPIEVRGG